MWMNALKVVIKWQFRQITRKKMYFCIKVKLWQVEHFWTYLTSLLGVIVIVFSNHAQKVRTNMLWKWSTGQSFIFPKWHSFKIGTLASKQVSELKESQWGVWIHNVWHWSIWQRVANHHGHGLGLALAVVVLPLSLKAGFENQCYYY